MLGMLASLSGCSSEMEELIIEEKPSVSIETVLPESWMKQIPDETPISQLAIPGTHDSAAFLEKLLASARTQSDAVSIQLQSGVRFLDIRPKATSTTQTEDLPIYHGIVNLEVSLMEVINQMTSFLETNPSEMLIYTMRNEDTNAKYQEVWETTIRTIFENLKAAGKTVDLKADLTLGECRGKMLFLTRTGDSDYRAEGGLYVGGAQNWFHNCLFENDMLDPQGEKVVTGHVLDYYKLEKADDAPDKEAALEKKKQLIATNLENATQNKDANHWYVTYLSGYSAFGFLGLADGTPLDLAKTVNPYTLELLKEKSGKPGIVVLDYATNEEECAGISLINRIIALNY